MEAENHTSDLTSDFQEGTRKSMGERIRQLWVNSGEQQDEFVKHLGVSTVTLSNYMNGKRKPDSEFLFALKKKLNIRIDWLLDGEGSMRPGEPASEPQTPVEQPVIPTKTAEHCPRCERLEEKLEEVEKERREKDKELRELSAELRVVSAENRDLWRENGNLRVLCARFEEQQKSSPEEPIPDMAEAIRSSEVLARI